MKIIDKTPLVNEKGELGLSQRLQGMMQFGFDWPNQLKAQKVIVGLFDRQLEKGFTLIRNFALGQSGIVIPFILVGPTGIHVINITYQRGHFEAVGDTWNVESGSGSKPAPVNLVQQTMRMTRALTSWIERQGTRLPVEIESVLIAGDPGVHISSTRPAIKVMMIDGIKSYVSSLATGEALLSTEGVYELTERIMNPRLPKKQAPAAQPFVDEPLPPQPEISRARAIFNAAQEAEAKPFNPSDFDFAMIDQDVSMDAAPVTDAPSVQEESPAQPLPRSKPRTKRIMGMTPIQLAIVIALFLLLVCIVAGSAYYYFAFLRP